MLKISRVVSLPKLTLKSLEIISSWKWKLNILIRQSWSWKKLKKIIFNFITFRVSFLQNILQWLTKQWIFNDTKSIEFSRRASKIEICCWKLSIYIQMHVKPFQFCVLQKLRDIVFLRVYNHNCWTVLYSSWR